MRIGLIIAKRSCLYLDIFSCVKINVFRPFFAFRLKMQVRCDNQYNTGSEERNILGQPMLFECMGICFLSIPAHEREMRGSPVCLLIVKYLSILSKFSHTILKLDSLNTEFWGDF